LVLCVLEFRCRWVGVVSVLQAEGQLVCASTCNTDTTPTQQHRNSNTHRTKNNTTNVVMQQNSRKFLMMDILISETCWAHKKWNKIALRRCNLAKDRPCFRPRCCHSTEGTALYCTWLNSSTGIVSTAQCGSSSLSRLPRNLKILYFFIHPRMFISYDP